jgi:hypothetical protein
MSGEGQERDRAFIEQVKRVLDRSLDDVDPVTAWRLQRARQSALSHGARPIWWVGWVSSAALASIAILALMLWVRQPGPEHHAAVPLEDFELVTSVENVELAEDLDFYHWLADDDANG